MGRNDTSDFHITWVGKRRDKEINHDRVGPCSDTILEMGHSLLKRPHKREDYPNLYREARIITKPMWDKDLKNLTNGSYAHCVEVNPLYSNLKGLHVGNRQIISRLSVLLKCHAYYYY